MTHQSLHVLPTAEQAELEALLVELVAINSVNPWITPGAPGEGDVAAFLAERLRRIEGVEVTVDEVVPGRSNVLARVSGSGTGRHLCVHVHTDTVDCADWSDVAFRARRDGDRLLGLGVADNKAQAAAMVLLVARLAADPPEGDVTAVFAIDEEGPSLGTHHLVKTLRADGAIALEPIGNGRAIVSHQGFGSLDLTVRAAAAHGLEDDAPDAIVQLAELVRGLAAIDRDLLTAARHPLAGKPFFHTSWVRGGTDYGTYPSEITMGFEMGTVPGETLADRIAEVEEMIDATRELHPTLDAEVTVKLENDPFESSGHETLLAAYGDATLEVTGAPLEPSGLNTWADSAILQAAGIPTILCGALGGNWHAIDEWSDLNEVAGLVLILEGASRRFCVSA